MDASFFENNRKQLAKMMPPGSIAILPGKPILNHFLSRFQKFEQDSEFYYLTGIEEPNAAVALVKHKNKKVEYVVFSLEDIPENVPLIGHLMGTQGAVKDYGADKAYPNKELNDVIPKLFKDISTIYYPYDSKAHISSKISSWRDQTKKLVERGEKKTSIPIQTKDVSPLISLLRLRKSKSEIKSIEQAALVTSNAYKRIFAKAKPGVSEFEIARKFDSTCKKESQQEIACATIVASGFNASIIHHKPSHDQLTNHELFIVQGGASINKYCGVIARTIPAGGHFTPGQASLYQLLLDAQQKGLKKLTVHHTFQQVERKVLKILTEGFLKLGIIPEHQKHLNHDALIKSYFPDGFLSFVGLDPQDPLVLKPGKILPTLKKSMVVNLNLSLCLPAGDSHIPAQYRGIGMRVSDIVLIKSIGNRVLSDHTPKEIEDIQRYMAENRREDHHLLYRFEQERHEDSIEAVSRDLSESQEEDTSELYTATKRAV